MMSWSRNWLSSVVKRDPEVKSALDELTHLIREHEDAAKPSACRGPASRLSASVDFFRPNWKLFAFLGGVFGVAGAVLGMTRPDFNTGPWADALLRTAVTVFVLGVSLVNLTRSISESGRFAGQYLNDSCRMGSFCCITMLSALIALVARFSIALAPVPVSVGLCAAALGSALASLAMLAFVMLETMRCSLPGKAVEMVSKYAARKLTYAYLEEAFVRLVRMRQKECLEQQCLRDCNSIYPPSQHYMRLGWTHRNPGSGKEDREISWGKSSRRASQSRDYALDRLRTLDHYLHENDAELYLSSPEYMGKQVALGTLRFPVGKQAVYEDVCRRLNNAVRMSKIRFEEENGDFWDRHEVALNEAIERAVDNGDPTQVRAYLHAVNEPLKVLRQTRGRKPIRDAYGENVERGHKFVRLYQVALDEILASQENTNEHRMQRRVKLALVLLRSVWDETQRIVGDLDQHTMKLFTWLVQEMYRMIHHGPVSTGPLWEMRAQFGGFYKFAGAWLGAAEPQDVEGAQATRLVLYEGLTRWLLSLLDDPGEKELAKQLCDAARGIVFRDQTITFDRPTLVAQHFVLAGHLMRHPEVAGGKGGAVECLFNSRGSRGPDVNFNDLATFYIEYPFPPQVLDQYLHLFFKPHMRREDRLTGSVTSSGGGSTGVHEMVLAFIYLAASALANDRETPEARPEDLSYLMRDEVMDTVKGFFNDLRVNIGLAKLKAWRDECAELHGRTEAGEIAAAPLQAGRVEQWCESFWEAYSKSCPVLLRCLENGSYETDDLSELRLQYVIHKARLIDGEHQTGEADGSDLGRFVGETRDAYLLRTMLKAQGGPSRIQTCLSAAVAEAVSWLANRGCDDNRDFVIVASESEPASALYREGDFVPPWHEDLPASGSNGFFRGFPIFWLPTRDDAEQGSSQVNEGVTAVDLRGWRGIKVRQCVIAQGEFGKAEIRTWKDEELEAFVKAGELKSDEVDKAKGNCPVQVDLYWQFSGDDLPATQVFEFGAANDTGNERVEPPTPTEEESAPASKTTHERPKRVKVARQRKSAQTRKRQK